MAKFCSYCGKELVNGQCDCPQFQNMRAQSVSGYEGAQQETYQQDTAQSDYAEMTKKHAGNLGILMMNALKNPVTAIRESVNDANHVPAFLAGVVYFLVFIIAVLLRVPSVAEMVLGNKFLLGIRLGLVMVLGEALVMAAVFGFVKLKKSDVDFMTVASVVCVTTIVPSAGYIITVIVSYISGMLASALLLAIFICWVMLNYEAVKACTKAEKNIAFWMTAAVVGVSVLAVMLIMKSYFTGLIMNAAGDALMSGMF